MDEKNNSFGYRGYINGDINKNDDIDVHCSQELSNKIKEERKAYNFTSIFCFCSCFKKNNEKKDNEEKNNEYHII